MGEVGARDEADEAVGHEDIVGGSRFLSADLIDADHVEGVRGIGSREVGILGENLLEAFLCDRGGRRGGRHGRGEVLGGGGDGADEKLGEGHVESRQWC